MKYEIHNDLRDKPIMSMYSFNRDSFSKATPQTVDFITTTMAMCFFGVKYRFSHYRYKIPLRKLEIRMRRQKLHIGYENHLDSRKGRCL